MINAFGTKNIAWMNYKLTWTHKTHHGSNLKVVTIFLPIIDFVSSQGGTLSVEMQNHMHQITRYCLRGD
jgi:hypothetical protein